MQDAGAELGLDRMCKRIDPANRFSSASPAVNAAAINSRCASRLMAKRSPRVASA